MKVVRIDNGLITALLFGEAFPETINSIPDARRIIVMKMKNFMTKVGSSAMRNMANAISNITITGEITCIKNSHGNMMKPYFPYSPLNKILVCRKNVCIARLPLLDFCFITLLRLVGMYE